MNHYDIRSIYNKALYQNRCFEGLTRFMDGQELIDVYSKVVTWAINKV